MKFLVSFVVVSSAVLCFAGDGRDSVSFGDSPSSKIQAGNKSDKDKVTLSRDMRSKMNEQRAYDKISANELRWTQYQLQRARMQKVGMPEAIEEYKRVKDQMKGKLHDTNKLLSEDMTENCKNFAANTRGIKPEYVEVAKTQSKAGRNLASVTTERKAKEKLEKESKAKAK